MHTRVTSQTASITEQLRQARRRDGVRAQLPAITNRMCIIVVRSLVESSPKNHDLDQ